MMKIIFGAKMTDTDHNDKNDFNTNHCNLTHLTKIKKKITVYDNQNDRK